MKRKSVKILLCSALLAMALAVSACGSKKEDKEAAETTPTPTVEIKEEEPTKEPAEEAAAEPTEAPVDETAEEQEKIEASEDEEMPLVKFATVKEFAESDMIQEELEELKNSLKGSGMDITITGDEDKLIYTYTYSELENMDGFAEQLAAAMEDKAETFETIAASIREVVDVENPAVVVTYVDANGEEIYSVDFTAE